MRQDRDETKEKQKEEEDIYCKEEENEEEEGEETGVETEKETKNVSSTYDLMEKEILLRTRLCYH